ncbi:MAG: hypothetical protein ACW9W4_06540 [Candidatus Nitrosopumilus sp. bin_7KS]
MKTKLSKKRAISTVLTTVIILVSSVVLGSGVVLYGTSLFQSGTQTENINISGTNLWVHTEAPEGLAWGAAGIRNTGDKVVAVDKIQIRGADIPFTQWYPDTTVTAATFQKSLNHTGWSGSSGALTADATCTGLGQDLRIDLVGDDDADESICATQALGPVSLNPGQAAVIYFKLTNGTITSLDSGISTTVSIFAGKAGGPASITVTGVAP